MKRPLPPILLLAATLCPAERPAQAPPAGFETVDAHVKIGMLVGRLRFDKERFVVAPGAKVKLTLTNNDAMQHNLIIVKPGKASADAVGQAALLLGAKAMDRHFVPESDLVLFHTKAILPGQSDTIWFRAPKEPGDYPYICTLPGHMFTMRGVMRVGKGGGEKPEVTPLRNARYRFYRGAWKKLPDVAALAPTGLGACEGGRFDIHQIGQRNDFAVVFEGELHVPAAGEYTFRLNSDDGSRLHVNGEMVAEYDGLHGMAKERVAKVQLGKGGHAIVVEFFQGRGGLGLFVACEGPQFPRYELSAKRRAAPPKGLPISVMDEPVVLRVHLEHTGGRNIAVGLPGGMNYCFDAEACTVRYGWAGAFLDVGPDRLGRGGQPCRILGQRFEVGDLGFPLRDAAGQAGQVNFRGYRLDTWPEFLLDWNGAKVTWRVQPATQGVGLRYEFEIDKPASDIQFVVDDKMLKLSASAGTWEGGTLAVPRAAAKRFSVSLRQNHGH